LGPNTGGIGAYSPAPILEGKHSTYTLNHIIKTINKYFSKKEQFHIKVLYMLVL